MVDGVTYEWIDGVYFEKINTIEEGQSFGETALLKKTVRNATIKAEDRETHFATLSYAKFSATLAKIEEERVMKRNQFVNSIPCFSSMTPRDIWQFSDSLKPVEFTRG